METADRIGQALDELAAGRITAQEALRQISALRGVASARPVTARDRKIDACFTGTETAPAVRSRWEDLSARLAELLAQTPLRVFLERKPPPQTGTEAAASDQSAAVSDPVSAPAPPVAPAPEPSVPRARAAARCPVTVLAVNLRNFDLVRQHLPPEQTLSALREFYCAVYKVVVANRGLLCSHCAESLLAVFDDNSETECHALQAVRAALDLPPALHDLFVHLDEDFGWELGVGIGLSSGTAILGPFEWSEYQGTLLLGDVIGEAQRLEAATKAVPEEDTILLSPATYRLVRPQVHACDLGARAKANDPLRAYVLQGFRAEPRPAKAA